MLHPFEGILSEDESRLVHTAEEQAKPHEAEPPAGWDRRGFMGRTVAAAVTLGGLLGASAAAQDNAQGGPSGGNLELDIDRAGRDRDQAAPPSQRSQGRGRGPSTTDFDPDRPLTWRDLDQYFYDRGFWGGGRGGATTYALGEEGGGGGQMTTYALGEEGGGGGRATTYALGEEGAGGGRGQATTYALGEEGARGGGWPTTYAMGEEGGSGYWQGGWSNRGRWYDRNQRRRGRNGDRDQQRHTTQALGEEGGRDQRRVTTYALGEEG